MRYFYLTKRMDFFLTEKKLMILQLQTDGGAHVTSIYFNRLCFCVFRHAMAFVLYIAPG